MEKMPGNIVKDIPFVPDDIITNILSYLPVRSAMRCRLVCKKWRDLTSSRDFVDLHFKRNRIPLILVVAWKEDCFIQMDEFDRNWWEIATMEGVMRITNVYFSEKSYKPCVLSSRDALVLFSHDGILVFLEESRSSGTRFVIVNPTRQRIESVSLTFPEELERSEIYGVYYHPSVKEYCSLCKIEVSSAQLPDRFEYKILTLGSNPSMKTICNPFNDRGKAEGASPLLINNCLYWKLESFQQDGHNDIMEFDVIKEEFLVIPCPIPLNTECEPYQTHLLNSDGVLCFVLLHSNKVTIWRRSERLWTTTEYTFDIDFEIYDRVRNLNVIAVVDGKLAIRQNRRLCVCNLMDGTVLKYPEFRVPAYISFISHRMSLASLCNGKTRIFIDQDDKFVVT